MKRFHVHLAVDDLAQSIGFYSALFGGAPAVRQPDYAKWMLEDPRVNFAISSRGLPAGIDHLGLQVDSDDELAELRNRVAGARLPAADQENAACCYARSNKTWTRDPQGVAWEAFHTMEQVATYGQDTKAGGAAAMVAGDAARNAPPSANAQSGVLPKSACCGPARPEAAKSLAACC
jgi:catechol 2,3-dioxygenase-like lactoylglutathione lyase family enzyme